MFHYIVGKIIDNQPDYIINDHRGIQALYHGKQTSWAYFLYPMLDERSKTIAYYAFDSAVQKSSFESVLKISWIWPKTAYELARTDQQKLYNAINDFDLSFFQSIKGIGPKTAKKILVELKSNFSEIDLIKINADDRLVKDITKSLGQMGYDRQQVLQLLSKYDQEISQKTLQTVVQRLIGELK